MYCSHVDHCGVTVHCMADKNSGRKYMLGLAQRCSIGIGGGGGVVLTGNHFARVSFQMFSINLISGSLHYEHLTRLWKFVGSTKSQFFFKCKIYHISLFVSHIPCVWYITISYIWFFFVNLSKYNVYCFHLNRKLCHHQTFRNFLCHSRTCRRIDS